jgi:hypothetical protein
MCAPSTGPDGRDRAAFTSSARLAGMFDETQSRRLKPAEDRPGHFAIRKGVRCAGVHLIIDPHGAERLDDIDYIDAALLPESFARNVAAHVSSALQVNGVSDGFATKYWTPEVQDAAFALPRFIAEIAAKAKA